MSNSLAIYVCLRDFKLFQLSKQFKKSALETIPLTFKGSKMEYLHPLLDKKHLDSFIRNDQLSCLSQLKLSTLKNCLNLFRKYQTPEFPA